MCYKHIKINDFIKEVKDWYKFDFTKRELRDIFKYYETTDGIYFPTEINLRKYWRCYKSIKEAVEDLWDKDSIYDVDNLDTDEKRMKWLENNVHFMVIYTDRILINL